MIINQAIELLQEHWTYALLSLLAVFTIYSTISSYGKPKVINIHTKETPPVIGLPKTLSWFFPKLRSRLASIQHIPDWVSEGYYKYSKNGKPFMVHSIDGDMVVLPPPLIGELKNLPSNKADIRAVETLCINYTFDKYVATDFFHVPIIRKDLTAKLGAMTPAIVEELDLSMRHFIDKMAKEPDEKGWRKINLFELTLKVVARTSHRVFIGEELCREEQFLDTVINYATGVIPASLALNCVPKFTWPVLGPIICYPLARLRRRARKHIEPVVKKRIAALRSDVPASERPNDFMQWILEASLARGGEYTDMDAITTRMLTVAFAAIHTTSLSGTNTFYDLASLDNNIPPGQKTHQEILREELMSVFPPPHEFNKRYMQRLYNMDAFLKESVRLNLTGAIHSDRVVTAKDGITTSTGLHLPRGASFAFPSIAKMRDEDVYENGKEHQFTRFYRGDLAGKEGNGGDDDEEVSNEKSGFGGGAGERKLDRYMVTVTDDYPAFGVGVHACPGRFFAANELRVLVAWFLLNYDLKPIETRPKPFRFLWNDILDTSAILEIRSRKD